MVLAFFFSTPGILLLGLIALIYVVYIAIPLKKVRSYEKYGGKVYFAPVLGFFKMVKDNLKNKGDCMATFKEAFVESSNPKFIATNIVCTPFLLLQDPTYIKEFFQKQNNYVKTLITDVFEPLVGTGLVTAEGDTWKWHRKILAASFNFDFLKTNMPVIQNTAREVLSKLTADDFKNYSIISRTQGITGQIVGRLFFGKNFNNYTFEGLPLHIAVDQIATELTACAQGAPVALLGPGIMKLPFIPKYRNLLQRVAGFRQVCHQIIQDRKAKPEGSNDLLSALLATQSAPDAESRLSDDDIVDEFCTFLIAGMGTTANLVGMTLYNLTQNPEYLAKLKAERDATFNKEQQITNDTLSKMEVLHSVLKESLRLYLNTPLVFLRKALFDHDILDIKVKKGDILSVGMITPAFDPKYFENPTEFKPERWTKPDSKLDSQAFFIPFSYGPRTCIGNHLAMIEAKVIMSEFLNRFEFDLKEGYQLKMTMRFLYEPLDPIELNLRPKVQN